MEKLTLDEFYEKTEKSPYCDIVVEIMLKYNNEPDFRTCTAIYEKESSENPDSWVWNIDWYEGEDEVYIIGCAAIDTIDVVGRFDI